MGASASTPLPAAGMASAPTTPKAELDDLRFFGHAPAAVEKDHTWFYEVVAAALLASARGGKIATYMLQAVADGEFAPVATPASGEFTLAQHACWRKYRAVVTSELVATCENFDYNPHDILTALERHADQASPSELGAIQGLHEVADLLVPYQDFNKFARMMAVRSVGQQRKKGMKTEHEKPKVPRPPPPRELGTGGRGAGSSGESKRQSTPTPPPPKGGKRQITIVVRQTPTPPPPRQPPPLDADGRDSSDVL